MASVSVPDMGSPSARDSVHSLTRLCREGSVIVSGRSATSVDSSSVTEPLPATFTASFVIETTSRARSIEYVASQELKRSVSSSRHVVFRVTGPLGSGAGPRMLRKRSSTDSSEIESAISRRCIGSSPTRLVASFRASSIPDTETTEPSVRTRRRNVAPASAVKRLTATRLRPSAAGASSESKSKLPKPMRVERPVILETRSATASAPAPSASPISRASVISQCDARGPPALSRPIEVVVELSARILNPIDRPGAGTRRSSGAGGAAPPRGASWASAERGNSPGASAAIADHRSHFVLQRVTRHPRGVCQPPAAQSVLRWRSKASPPRRPRRISRRHHRPQHLRARAGLPALGRGDRHAFPAAPLGRSLLGPEDRRRAPDPLLARTPESPPRAALPAV